jgi:hypothetical protein
MSVRLAGKDIYVNNRCIAFREERRYQSVIYVPCGEKIAMPRKRRFCKTHARAYREILLGILSQGPREKL